ncbi:MAG: CBS domain-containing protein [Hellea sp.]|nr:CBS domain-containing protein [Hellea sp.]
MSEDPSSTNWLERVLGRGKAPGSDSQETPDQKRMMNAAEQFHLLRVVDVMVPRADIIAVDIDTGLHDLSKAFQDAGHSRLPIYKESLDEPIGMVHIKDVLPYLMLNARGRSAKTYKDRKVLNTIKRPVLFVPPSMLAQDLLSRMQARRTHMAIVVDEYGGTDGILTIEDIIEEIVGEIEDEHDDVDLQVKTVRNENSTHWMADARISIDELEEAIGREFASADEEGEVDTLGGLIFTLAGRVPERGEIIYHPDGIEFEIIDADPRRVKVIKVRTLTKSALEKAKNNLAAE